MGYCPEYDSFWFEQTGFEFINYLIRLHGRTAQEAKQKTQHALELVGMVEETSIEECRTVFEINYFGAVRMVRAVLPGMREQRSGLIINTSSVAGHLAVPYEAHYCAMKLAVDIFTRALRQEVRPFGIRCVVVAPGYVRTSFYDVLRRPAGELDA